MSSQSVFNKEKATHTPSSGQGTMVDPENGTTRDKRHAACQGLTNAFVLAVQLTFPNMESQKIFLERWQRLAAFVQDHEPETLAFEALQSDSDPLMLLIYERYTSRSSYENIHRKSEAFTTFKTWLMEYPHGPDISGQSYVETNKGFM